MPHCAPSCTRSDSVQGPQLMLDTAAGLNTVDVWAPAAGAKTEHQTATAMAIAVPMDRRRLTSTPPTVFGGLQRLKLGNLTNEEAFR